MPLLYITNNYPNAESWSRLVVIIGVLTIIAFVIRKPFSVNIRELGILGVVVCVLLSFVTAAVMRNYDENIQKSIEDKYRFIPFAGDALAINLAEPPSLRLSGNLPRISGAHQLYPLYSAFVRATYPEEKIYEFSDDFDRGLMRTWSFPIDSLNGLLEDEVDIAFIFLDDISRTQLDHARTLGIELDLTPIGSEAFVFFVNRSNPVSNLTVDEVVGIYSGAITNWVCVGGRLSRIQAYQRRERTDSQAVLQRVMRNVPLMEPPTELVGGGLFSSPVRVTANYRNYSNSIGFTFRHNVPWMMDEGEVKLLSIDGVDPSRENIANGTYPLAGNFYAITVKREHEAEAEAERAKNAEALIEWILSEQGQGLVAKAGYVPVSHMIPLTESIDPVNRITIKGNQFVTRLTELDLSSMGLQDEDIVALQHMTHLRRLNLSDNQISDLTPLANLENLETLWLSVNSISDLTPLSSLTNLTSLYLSVNSISDLTPLAALTNLTELWLSVNSISDLSPLSGLMNLRSLELSGNQISDLTPLFRLRNLRRLVLSSNQISDLSALSAIRTLFSLDLSRNQIVDISPLSYMRLLDHLNLSGNPITDWSPVEHITNVSGRP